MNEEFRMSYITHILEDVGITVTVDTWKDIFLAYCAYCNH